VRWAMNRLAAAWRSEGKPYRALPCLSTSPHLTCSGFHTRLMMLGCDSMLPAPFGNARSSSLVGQVSFQHAESFLTDVLKQASVSSGIM
jgi:hypothetical protein